MTQDYHKPTHTLVGDGTYNASQVRLYGIEAMTAAKPPLYFGDSMLVAKSDDAVDEYGNVSIPNGLNINSRSGEAVLILSRERSIGIIYGYAFEGHCYDLPRPMIMLLPVPPEPPRAKDCDYDGRQGYMVWVVDKLDECDVIDVKSGFIEQLVLDANMPGKRSPSTYSAHMQFAHRSGRMPE